MKIKLMLAMLFACALATHAQTEKGKIILGGSIGLSHSTGKFENPITLEGITNFTQISDNKVNTFSLGPNVGFFVKDNLALGLGVTYLTLKATNSGTYISYSGETTLEVMNVNNEFKSNLLWLSPYTRYYVNITDKFKFFGQLSVPMAWGTQKNQSTSSGGTSSSEYKSSHIGVNLLPGFTFFPTKKIGIEFSFSGLEYTHYNSKNKLTGDKASGNSFGFNANTSVPKLGFMFYL